MPNRIIGGYLVTFLVGLLIGRRRQNQYRSSGGRVHEPIDKNRTLDPLRLDIANDDWPADSGRHQRNEATYWIASTVVSVAALLAACVAVYYANGAFQQARRQADAAEASNRAWIAITAFKLDKIDTTDKIVIAAGTISFSNVGKSPAQNIEQRLDIIPNRIFGVTATKAFCDSEKNRRAKYSIDPLDIAFPETREARDVYGDEDIDKFIKEDIDANHEFFEKLIKPILNQNKIGTNEFIENPGKDKMDHPVFEFVIIGCVTYRSGEFGEKLHGTGFSYRVSTKSQNPKNMGFYFGSRSTRNSSEFILEKTPTGAYAD